MTVANDALLAAVLDYARRGWACFPCHTPGPKGCSCHDRECANVGKHPRTRRGFLDATADEDRLRQWWSQWPDANIGIATGESGLVVIDIDPRHGGDESWGDIVTRLGRHLNDTLEVETGSKGTHLYFKAIPGTPIGNVSSSDRFTGPLGVGVDVRAAGGYVIAPPSLHASGGRYEWIEDDRVLAPLPFDLADLLIPKDHTERQPMRSMGEILSGVGEGSRDWELFQAAAKLRYADVPRDLAEELILRAASRCTPPFPAKAALAKVESAYSRYAPSGGVHAAPAALTAPDDFAARRELLGPAIQHGVTPPAWLIEGLVVQARVHILYGEPESGKTILALSFAVQCVRSGLHVVFVDEESGIAAIAPLLAVMGLTATEADTYVHYFPFPGVDETTFDALLAYCDEVQPALVVFDSLTDMLASAGLDEDRGIEVTKWMMRVPVALSRAAHGAAVVLVDHVAKSLDNTRYSVGSRAKKAKADVMWHVVKKVDFDREHMGKVELQRHKNRPGVLPRQVNYTVGGSNGELVCRPFDVSQDGITSLSSGAARVANILAENGEPMSAGAIRMQLSTPGGGHPSKTTVWKYLDELVASGKVESEGTNRDVVYYLTVQVNGSTVQVNDGQPFGVTVHSVPPYRGTVNGSQVGERTAIRPGDPGYNEEDDL